MAVMSKAAIVSAVGAVGTAIAAFFSEGVRDVVSSCAGLNAPGGWWRLLAIALALANIKMLPGMWHIRFLTAYFYQMHFQPTPIPPHALFQPLITTTRCTLLETDYNMHKSNSTYFADMDISRTHLFSAIIRRAVQKVAKKDGALPSAAGATTGTNGPHMIALGGIACNFKKDIKPLAKYEMWTRLMTWDRKWFYLVTHLVRPGSGSPKEWTLQPWKKGAREDQEWDKETMKGAVYATAIAKYVIKEGRKTVPPEQVLIEAEMVPQKPEGWVYHGEVEGEDAMDGSFVVPEKATEEGWNWDVIEKERLKGLKLAENFLSLDALHDKFDGGESGALGHYFDL